MAFLPSARDQNGEIVEPKSREYKMIFSVYPEGVLFIVEKDSLQCAHNLTIRS